MRSGWIPVFTGMTECGAWALARSAVARGLVPRLAVDAGISNGALPLVMAYVNCDAMTRDNCETSRPPRQLMKIKIPLQTKNSRTVNNAS